MNAVLYILIMLYGILSATHFTVTILMCSLDSEHFISIYVNNYKSRLYNFVNGNKILYFSIFTLACILYFICSGLIVLAMMSFVFCGLCIVLLQGCYKFCCSITPEQPPQRPNEPLLDAVNINAPIAQVV